MATQPDVGTYTILLNERWTLEDLYSFPHVYDQVYSFLFSLEVAPPEDFEELEDRGMVRYDDRIDRAYRAYPWHGGYSAVNFYQNLAAAIPRGSRPQIRSIQYSSPGWLELSLLIPVALSIKTIVNHLVEAGAKVNALYGEIQTGISERKLRRIEIRRKELELNRENIAFAEDACQRLSKMLGFKDLDRLHRRTHNPIASLKILLSAYRRVRTLAEYEEDGFIDLTGRGPE